MPMPHGLQSAVGYSHQHVALVELVDDDEANVGELAIALHAAQQDALCDDLHLHVRPTHSL